MNDIILRCEEVIGRLAGTGELSGRSAEIDRHLSTCPECAQVWNPDAPVLKLWRETSPVLPNEANFDAMWGKLSSQLDRAEVAVDQEVAPTFTMRRLVAGRRRQVALAGFVLAQAAVVLLVVSLGFRERTRDSGPAPAPASSLANVVVEAGQTILIQKDGETVKAVEVAYVDAPATIDTNYELFNTIEAMAN